MAVWGAPFADPDDPLHAVQAAVDMQRALAQLNLQRAARGHERIHIHVGVNTGRVAAGNIGSDRYVQYATIGDATNVASRACGVARPGQILITEETRARLRGLPWEMVPLAPVSVKGKTEPLHLYAVRWEP
jgi:adenylate cyclase